MPETIEALLSEGRSFPPPESFSIQANVSDGSIYEEAERDYVSFWEKWAERLDWHTKWDQALQWDPPYAKWFVGGKLNACFNCVDRHTDGDLSEKVAIISEGEPGDVRTFTYSEVKLEVARLANALKLLGVKKGDIVCIYMPMVAELAFAMLACTRIGAAHTVVFGGFSADALRERIADASAVCVITADGGWRRGKVVELKKTVDDAIAGATTVRNVLTLRRIGDSTAFNAGTWVVGRDHWWHELVTKESSDCPCEVMDSEDLLFTLYTSGSTGKPKGIVHTTGGYLTGTSATFHCIFDHKPSDIYWCTADCGWITGHSYVVYGPMANGATVLMYEGSPDTPDKDRFWKIVEKHKVTILYTAPTAIRTFMKWGEQFPGNCDLSSLRLLGTVGEPINPEAWVWYWKHIGNEKCPIVDTWWQTETGQILISPLPGLTRCKPGSATHPFPGIKAELFSEDGHLLEGAKGGYLVLTRPWPAMLRGLYNDHDRYVETYWSRFPGVYFTGDGAKRDDDGFLWLLGRVDDVMNVAGHRISTMEVESALVDHPAVAEAAVIGRSHEVKGQAISAFVLLRSGFEGDHLVGEIREHVASVIGPIARPDDLFVCADLPKTRSGKIMRRLLRDIAEGRALGDTTTLADSAVVAGLRQQYEHLES
ncbi:MAG: acetate--CoA ligase [Fimbriimonadales bacterium]|nr:acetate--CoA ligase [Fimbriimonadales bacterium]